MKRNSNKQNAARLALLAGLSVSLVGCELVSKLREPPELQGLPAVGVSIDDSFARMALRIPGFAGAFVDTEGAWHVKVVAPPAQLPGIESVALALRQVGLLPSGDSRPRIVVQVSNTRYAWSDLLQFTQQMRDVLNIDGASFLDTDETAGLVVVGITDNSVRAKIEEFARAAAVPSDAWTTEIAPMRQRFADLQGFFRPLVGGVQIKNDSGPFAFLGFAGICTLGIVGEHAGATGFITNSHCTRVQGGIEGTNFRQSGRDILWGDYVAHESVDPQWTPSLPGCPSGKLCRFSDSSFAVVDIGNQNASFASVARPSHLCNGGAPCDLSMNAPSDRIEITGTSPALLSGTPITKVGRTTGWTGGAVVRTCVHEPQAGSNLVVLCQTETGALSMPGDSGSPVVVTATAPVNPLPTRGTLAGILWGGSPGVSVFSPIDAVTSELGGVRLFPVAGGGGGGAAVPVSACVRECRAERDACMRDVANTGGPRPGSCVGELRGCLQACP